MFPKESAAMLEHSPTTVHRLSSINAERELVWQSNLKSALKVALENYKPVLALFTHPNCQWCERLKFESLRDPEIEELLKHFALVEIDISMERATARTYQVSGVPTILLLYSDGRTREKVSGYRTAANLKTLLERQLNPDFVDKRDTDSRELLSQLESGSVADENWPLIMAAMGKKQHRRQMRNKILDMKVFPLQQLLELLSNKRIAVRLGALELLEEHLGENFGYDPWLPPDQNDENMEALQRFKTSAQNDQEAGGVRFSSLSAEQIDTYVRDIVAGNRQRTLRAKRMLEQGGEDAALRLSSFIEQNPDLPEGVIRRIKETQYTVMVPSLLGLPSSTVAHRLVYGNLDVRLKCIEALEAMREKAIPILTDFLEDENPMVRESAVDALSSIGGKRVGSILAQHLEEEDGDEVVFSIIKSLGGLRSGDSLELLKEYSSHPSEDLAIAALGSIARMDTRLAKTELKQALKDSRWRVRVAALEAVRKLKLKDLNAEVAERLDDDDEFVRHTAVKTLTTLSGKGGKTERLEKAFLKDDLLKGPVIAAFGSLDKPLPPSFKPALEGKSPEILLAVLEGLSKCGKKGLPIASEYLDHSNLDVACTAIRFVASRGMDQTKYQNKIIKVLGSQQKKKVTAALESIKIRSDLPGGTVSSREEIYLGDVLASSSNEDEDGNPDSESSEIEDLFGAFEEEDEESNGEESDAEENRSPEEENPAANLEALFADFGSGQGDEQDQQESAENNGVHTDAKGLKGLAEIARRHFEKTQDEEMRFAAAMVLLKLGEESVLPYLDTEMKQTTVERRIAVASLFNKLSVAEIQPLKKTLLNDSSESVRRAAVKSMLSIALKAKSHLDAVFEELLREESMLKLDDVFDTYNWQFVAARNAIAKNALRKWGLKLLNAENPAKRTFGILLLAKSWRKGDSKQLNKFMESEDPFQRRAAYYALGINERKSLHPMLDKVARDPSHHVRLVLPHVYTRRKEYGGGSNDWMHYLDKNRFVRGRHHYSSRTGNAGSLADKPRETLLELTSDEAPEVRIESYLCLLSNRTAIDLPGLIRTVQSFPDRERASGKIGDFLAQNYKMLGQSFEVLLPYLDYSRMPEDHIKKIKKHFHADNGAEEKNAEKEVVYREGDTPLSKAFREVEDKGGQPAETPPLRIFYFSTAGCSDCARVEAMLQEMKQVFQSLEVVRKDMKKVAAMRLNETLSQRFNVPHESRLVTPSVFASQGFLVRKEISFAELGNLLASSATSPWQDFAELSEQKLVEADESISHRYSAMGIGVVLSAGLLDGINPCAFATIIFLLSYLQVAKRKPSETARVGGAFIVAVFLSYLTMGFGIARVLTELTVLRYFGQALTWAMAAMALGIMLLNIRDGILCMSGRLDDTALQLPWFLKRRIHSTIRVGARHSHFIVAAFVAGVVISFLELACTGQVYLPTILFMLNTGQGDSTTIMYLLCYNLAFVAPLIVVFGFAYFGLSSDSLGHLMRKHAAAVKFATAILFLGLSVFLLFGDQVLTAMN